LHFFPSRFPKRLECENLTSGFAREIFELASRMRISFQRSGGFHPPAMRRRWVVDSESLTTQDAQELERLIAAADLTHLSQLRASPEPRPDVFYYRVDLEDGAQKHSLRFSDTDMPERLRQLLNWLRAKTGEQR
jgi:hypothetical protein